MSNKINSCKHFERIVRKYIPAITKMKPRGKNEIEKPKVSSDIRKT